MKHEFKLPRFTNVRHINWMRVMIIILAATVIFVFGVGVGSSTLEEKALNREKVVKESWITYTHDPSNISIKYPPPYKIFERTDGSGFGLFPRTETERRPDFPTIKFIINKTQDSDLETWTREQYKRHYDSNRVRTYESNMSKETISGNEWLILSNVPARFGMNAAITSIDGYFVELRVRYTRPPFENSKERIEVWRDMMKTLQTN